jgi:F0F1-type ATP synthase assembly protein I
MAGHGFHPNPSDPDLVMHERTYKAFNILIRWSMTLLASGISFLTLWFATGAGFIGGAVVGLIVFFVAWNFLVRHEEHQPLDVWQEGR